MNIADRVEQSTLTAGLGSYTLEPGASTNKQDFSTVFADGDIIPYCVSSDTAFEVGLGTLGGAGTSLARTTILSSSNAGAAVNWGAGAKSIFCTAPAGIFPIYGIVPPSATINPAFNGAQYIDKVSGSIYVCVDNTIDANVWVSPIDPTSLILALG